jgi:beta-fructofuranosidase
MEEGVFHTLFLNADPALAPTDEHHFHARIGYARTRDFRTVDWIDSDVFAADPDGWDNTSIWTGDVIRGREGYILFYTSRDRRIDDGMTQAIGAATSPDLIHWQRVPGFRIDPDPRIYQPRALPGDEAIHAWRDPYLFLHEGVPHMLVCAKLADLPPGRKGCIGLLRAVDHTLSRWEALPPIYAPGTAGECDVPVIYRQAGRYLLTHTIWPRYDHATGQGGSHLIRGDASLSGFETTSHVPLPGDSGVYAARIVPELGGDLVGFDVTKGGWRRVPVGLDGVEPADRDFREWWF